MGRRSEGPRLKWHRYGAAYYICWTEGGRSRGRSTGTGTGTQVQVPYTVQLGIRATSASTGFKITTGAAVSVIAVGRFTA
jgi:hypothetical protein